jgi:hypothetical protein
MGGNDARDRGHGRRIMRTGGRSGDTIAKTAEDHEEEHEAEEAGDDSDGDADGQVRFEPGLGSVFDAAGLTVPTNTSPAVAALAPVNKVG